MMKKIFYVLFAPLLFTLFSCSDVIFDEIRKEVKLEDPDISGSINSIVRFKDFVYIQNGNIWKKDADIEKAHGWKKIEKPYADYDFRYVNKLASDSTYLYAQMTLIKQDFDEGENIPKGCQLFYSSDGETWNGPISFGTDDEGNAIDRFISGSCYLFSTNAVKNEHRKAYVTYKSKVYKLDGSSVEEINTSSSLDSDLTTEPTYASRYCTYFKNSTYFSSYPIITNETKEADATYMYYAKGKDVYWTNDGNFSSSNSVDLDCSRIYSMSVTKDYLYLGTHDGIQHVAFKKEGSEYTSVPESKIANGLSNAESTLSSYYEVKTVLSLFPEKLESKNIIYGTADYSGSSSSSSATFENRGLWSYIASRGSWNRE